MMKLLQQNAVWQRRRVYRKTADSEEEKACKGG